jgi:hypothetical protein
MAWEYCFTLNYLHNHANYTYSHCIKLLGLVRYITFTFSYLECMHILYFRIIRFKHEYTSVDWNTITPTDIKKPERIHISLQPCFNRFFPQVHCRYSLALQLHLHTL